MASEAALPLHYASGAAWLVRAGCGHLPFVLLREVVVFAQDY